MSNCLVKKIVEDWKRALGDNKYIAAISMDLSKAFDCIPHNLLLLKLEAYGLTKQSLNLLKNYLEEILLMKIYYVDKNFISFNRT